MNKKIMLFVFAFILLTSSVYAYTQNNNIPATPTLSTSSALGRGMQFILTNTTCIVNVTRVSGADSDRLYVYNRTNNLLKTVDIDASGNWVVNLSGAKDMTYKITANKSSGASVTHKYIGGAAYNQTSIELNWTAGLYNNLVEDLTTYNEFSTIVTGSDCYVVNLTVSLTNPTNNTKLASVTGQTFNATGTPAETKTVVNATRFLWHSNGTFISTNFTSVIYAGNKTNFTIPSLNDGNYLWNIQLCDSSSICANATLNNSFTLDTTKPYINITYPKNKVYYFVSGSNISLNYTFVETNPSVCQYNYNSSTANTTITCGTNTTFQISEHRDRNITLFANDTAGNLGYNESNWSYYVFQYSNTVPSPVLGGSTQTFLYNFSSQYTPTAIDLVYNGTAHSATLTNPDTDMWYGSLSMIVPLSTSSVIKNTYWSVTFSDGSVVNSSVTTQTISPILFSLCTTNVNTTVLNVSAKDEELGNFLNFTMSAVFTYWNGNGSSADSLNYSFSNSTANNNYLFCVNPASTYINSTATLSYSRSGYGSRSYYFINSQFSNATQNLTLYLLNSSSSGVASVDFSVVDQSGNGVGGAYINIQKWDLATNTYNTVSVVQADSDGRTAATLQLNGPWYRYQVYYNGILYLVTSPLVETQTTRVLTINLQAGTPYNNFNSVYGDVAFNNNTNTFTFTFTDTSGTVGSGCLEVNKLSAASLTTVAYYCINASSGTAIYTATENGTYVANGIAILTNAYGSVQQTLDSLSVTIGRNQASAVVGTFGFIIFLILFVTMGAFGASSNSLILGSGLAVVSVIFAGWIGWISYSGMVLPISLVIIFIFIGIIAYRKYF